MADLYCVAVSGLDNIYAVSNRAAAYKIAQAMNKMLIEEQRDGERDDLYPIVWARPERWHLGKEAHGKDIEKNGPDWKQWPS